MKKVYLLLILVSSCGSKTSVSPDDCRAELSAWSALHEWEQEWCMDNEETWDTENNN